MKCLDIQFATGIILKHFSLTFLYTVQKINKTRMGGTKYFNFFSFKLFNIFFSEMQLIVLKFLPRV